MLPARQKTSTTLRQPLSIEQMTWFLQFSPFIRAHMRTSKFQEIYLRQGNSYIGKGSVTHNQDSLSHLIIS